MLSIAPAGRTDEGRIDGGVYREAETRALLLSAPYPVRSPDINIADLRAQLAGPEICVTALARDVARVTREALSGVVARGTARRLNRPPPGPG